MAHVTLPSNHAERDFALARSIAERLELTELHVFWPPAETAPPARARVAPPRGLLATLAALGALMEQLGERLLGLPRSRPPRR